EACHSNHSLPRRNFFPRGLASPVADFLSVGGNDASPYQPPQPPPQQGMSTGAKIALFGCGGCGGVLFLFIVSVILLGIVASSSSSNSGSNSSGSGGTSSASTPTEEEESYTVGDAVTHGDWEITVLSVEEGVTEIAESYRTHVPQGQYVVVELRVKNVSSGPEYFEDG